MSYLNTDDPGAPEATSGQQTDREAEIQQYRDELAKRDAAYRKMQSERDSAVNRANEQSPFAEIGRQFYEEQQRQQSQQGYVPQGGNVEVPPGYDTARPQVLWDQYGNPVTVNSGQSQPPQRQPASDPMLRAEIEQSKREAAQARREAAEAKAAIDALTQREQAVIGIQQELVAFRQQHPEIDDNAMERLATFEKSRMDDFGYLKPKWESARYEFFSREAEKEAKIAQDKRERARTQSAPVSAPTANIPLTQSEEQDAEMTRLHDEFHKTWQEVTQNE